MKKLLLIIPAIILAGCSFLKSTTLRTTSINPTNGVAIVTETTSAKGWTIFDANASLVKFSNRSGYATNASGIWAPGTYASGLNESSSSSNLVAILQAIAQLVSTGVK